MLSGHETTRRQSGLDQADLTLLEFARDPLTPSSSQVLSPSAGQHAGTIGIGHFPHFRALADHTDNRSDNSVPWAQATGLPLTLAMLSLTPMSVIRRPRTGREIITRDPLRGHCYQALVADQHKYIA
jgi:hypothetical protein